jgi:CHASE3 domain sensor protein
MTLRNSLLSGLIVSSVAFFAASFYSADNFINLSNAAELALQIANDASQVKETLIDAETGTRGYIITGNEHYLQPYNDATQRIDSDLNALSVYASRDAAEKANVANIIDLANEKMDILANVNRVRHDQGFEAAREATFANAGVGAGRRVMNDIRILITTIQVNEAYNNHESQNESKDWGELTILSVIGFAVSAILAILWVSIIEKTLRAKVN